MACGRRLDQVCLADVPLGSFFYLSLFDPKIYINTCFIKGGVYK